MRNYGDVLRSCEIGEPDLIKNGEAGVPLDIRIRKAAGRQVLYKLEAEDNKVRRMKSLDDLKEVFASSIKSRVRINPLVIADVQR